MAEDDNSILNKISGETSLTSVQSCVGGGIANIYGVATLVLRSSTLWMVISIKRGRTLLIYFFLAVRLWFGQQWLL